jgi:hypothetical protein
MIILPTTELEIANVPRAWIAGNREGGLVPSSGGIIRRSHGSMMEPLLSISHRLLDTNSCSQSKQISGGRESHRMDYLQSDPKKGLAAGLSSLSPSRHAKVLSLSHTRNPHAVTCTLLVFIDAGEGLSFRSNFRLCLHFF